MKRLQKIKLKIKKTKELLYLIYLIMSLITEKFKNFINGDQKKYRQILKDIYIMVKKINDIKLFLNEFCINYRIMWIGWF